MKAVQALFRFSQQKTSKQRATEHIDDVCQLLLFIVLGLHLCFGITILEIDGDRVLLDYPVFRSSAHSAPDVAGNVFC